MVSKGLFSLVIIGFGFFTLSVMILPISNQVNDLRTDAQTDTALACTTGPAATSCTITLSAKSAYEPAAPNMTVTETSPGTGTKTFTLDSNLLDVLISGLSSSTSYQFTVNYFKVDPVIEGATSLDSILKRFNLILVIGTLIVLVVGVGLSFNYRNSFS
tara:strand:- start:227 stop:703 length:477 start_codon:yes stop_codon:yes gene_type:complete